MVGSSFFISLGKFSVILYSASPIGLLISRNAYSASTLFFDLHKINPIEGLSFGCFKDHLQPINKNSFYRHIPV
ncbi:hypothetical protein RAS_11820 [Rickettsia asiatica]|uniref:Uncharacterized protein n=1 Tax=Rickettsia asiatica TaxID=238800 RepID=A0A510G899_9RICK|nr:hypothetical protein RAS_11820 [Rickettsia asiatica]